MKFLIFIALLTFSFAQPNMKLEIGSQIDSMYISKSTGHLYTGPSQIRPCFEIIVDGIKYTVAFDKSTLKIKYIFTSDKNFETSNGLKVGSEIKVLKKEVKIFRGWNVYSGKTDDGWDQLIGINFQLEYRDGTKVKDNQLPRFIPEDAFKDSTSLSFKIIGFKKGGNE